jgi:hypothetical protein
MAIRPITVKTEIPTGYMSRVQITERFKISESSLSNYQRDFPEFPNCFRQYISGINREIGTFKTVELVDWFNKKKLGGMHRNKVDKGLDMELIKVFFKHLDKRHFTQRPNSV